MNSAVVKALIEKGAVSARDLTKDKTVSSYTYYSTAEELEEFFVASKKNGKLVFSDDVVAGAFKKLFFEGFNVELLFSTNVKLLSLLLEPKTVREVSEEIGLSIAQTNNLVNKLSQFLEKDGTKYVFSDSNKLLYDFIFLLNKRKNQIFFWVKGNEKLLKVPLYFNFEGGVLTGFSRFSELGLMVNPSHSFVFFPKKELSIEEILGHAIKFSANANDLLLCILFYLKNKTKIDALEVEKICEKLDIFQLWFDMVAYLEEQPVREKKMFLPRAEFLAKAETYELRTVERFDRETISTLFDAVEKQSNGSLKVFFIGGNAMIEHKTKTSTKDVDLVVLTGNECVWLSDALKKSGFEEVGEHELQYGQLEAFIMLRKEGNPRIDLFVKKICELLPDNIL